MLEIKNKTVLLFCFICNCVSVKWQNMFQNPDSGIYESYGVMGKKNQTERLKLAWENPNSEWGETKQAKLTQNKQLQYMSYRLKKHSGSETFTEEPKGSKGWKRNRCMSASARHAGWPYNQLCYQFIGRASSFPPKSHWASIVGSPGGWSWNCFVPSNTMGTM